MWGENAFRNQWIRAIQLRNGKGGKVTQIISQTSNQQKKSIAHGGFTWWETSKEKADDHGMRTPRSKPKMFGKMGGS